jgi:glutamine synthetase
MLKLINGETKPLLSTAEYIWYDGEKIFSKTKVIEIYPTSNEEQLPVPVIKPISITYGGMDFILNPVHYVLDPFQKGANYIILCDIYKDSETPHNCNTRSYLERVLQSGTNRSESLVGFTQQFYLYKPKKHNTGISSNSEIYGWDFTGIDPIERSHFGVGADCVSGRRIILEHLKLCMDSGILICSANAEDDLGKWNFKIGYRNFSSDEDDATPIISADHLIFARYFLQRLCEKYHLAVDYSYKGCLLKANFSTWATRETQQGLNEDNVPNNIAELITTLESNHYEHLQHIGSPTNTPFNIKVPLSATHQGYGHIEDERAKGDTDPYVMCAKLLEHSCGLLIPRN